MGIREKIETKPSQLAHGYEAVLRQLDNIRVTVSHLAGQDAGPEGAHKAETESYTDKCLANIAAKLYKSRRARSKFIDPALTEEPVWDLMLDLFVQQLSGRRVSVTSACIASSVAPTTALRWITALTKKDLVERVPDPADQRRAFVQLTYKGMESMRGCLREVARTTGISIY